MGKIDKISFFFAGDFCVDQEVKASFIDYKVQDHILQHDFRWCNFEAPILNTNCQKIIKAGPHKSQHHSINYFLDKNLFNVFGLANNHIMDYGAEALKNTIETLESRGIEFHGAALDYSNAYEPLIIEKNGIKIALLALCENQFGCLDSEEHKYGYAWLFNPSIPNLIRATRDKCDFVVVLPHAGLEMYSFPLPEIRSYYKQLIEYGADLILGNHPHVIQGKEKYKGKYIYYSLGNLFFNYKGKTDEDWFKGLGLTCTFSNNGSINIEEKIFESRNSELHISKIDGPSIIEQRSKVFNNDIKYLELANTTALELWNKRFRMYSALPHLNGDYYQSNRLLKRLFYYFYNKFLSFENNSLLLHNSKIETNRFVIQRALKLLSRTY